MSNPEIWNPINVFHFTNVIWFGNEMCISPVAPFTNMDLL